MTLPYSGGVLRVQRTTVGHTEFADLLAHPASGQERASALASLEPGVKLTISGNGAGRVDVQGASQPITLQLVH